MPCLHIENENYTVLNYVLWTHSICSCTSIFHTILVGLSLYLQYSPYRPIAKISRCLRDLFCTTFKEEAEYLALPHTIGFSCSYDLKISVVFISDRGARIHAMNNPITVVLGALHQRNSCKLLN